MIARFRIQRPALAPTSLLVGLGMMVVAVVLALHAVCPLSAVPPAYLSEPDATPIPGVQAMTLSHGVACFEITEAQVREAVLVVSAFGRPESLTAVACLPVSQDEPLTEHSPVRRPSHRNGWASGDITPAGEHRDRCDTLKSAVTVLASETNASLHAVQAVRCSPAKPLTVWLLPQSTGAIRIETQPLVRCGRVRLEWDTRTPTTAADDAWGVALAEQMAQVWLPAVEARLGRCSAEGSANDLVVVITPAVATVAASAEPIEACVLPRDYDPSTSRLTDSMGGVLYVHPDLSAVRQPPILVHELAHVATLCRLRERYGAAPWPLQDWSSEGLAHAVELAVTGDPQNVAARLQAFAELPERSSLVVCDGRQTRRWRDPRCRGAACSFFVWASDTYGLPQVAEAVYATGQHDDPWTVALGTPWAELYRQWTIDNAVHNRVTIRPVTAATIDLEGTATTYLRLPHAGQWELRVPTDRDVTATIVRCARDEGKAPRQ